MEERSEDSSGSDGLESDANNKPIIDPQKMRELLEKKSEGSELGEELCNELINNIFHSSTGVTNNICDSLDCFMIQLIDVFKIQDFILPEMKTMEPYNIFRWMNYLYLQFCGYQYFSQIASQGGEEDQSVLAAAVIDLMDQIAENAEYLHFASDDPEQMAKNLIWRILNSPPLGEKYLGYTASHVVTDILNEIICEKIDPDQLDREGTEKEKKQVREKEELEWPVKTTEEEVLRRATCIEFQGIYGVAENFVTDIIQQSTTIAAKEGTPASDGNIKVEESTYRVDSSTSDSLPKFPAIKDFTVEIGRVSILEYLFTWMYEEDWTYEVVFLMAQSDACSDYYFYESKWSLPTKLCPIAQATASILFKIEVSRVKPPICAIDLTYQFEGSGFIHTPMDLHFQESWLFNILESKLLFYSKLKF